MRLETLPVILGILVALAGLALVADAEIPDGALVRPDRRSRTRPQRHLAGEAALGLGVVIVGVALIGRDAWRYTTVAMLAAFILCVAGVALNWRYVRAMLLGDTQPTPDAPGRPVPGSAPAPTTPAPSNAAPPDGGQRPERRVHTR